MLQSNDAWMNDLIKFSIIDLVLEHIKLKCYIHISIYTSDQRYKQMFFVLQSSTLIASVWTLVYLYQV